MAEYLSPGVYVEEFDSGPAPMQGVGTSTAGFVGAAQRGPIIGAPVLVTNPTDYTRIFGGFLSEAKYGEKRFLPYAVNQFFANGGGRAFIMRVAPEDASPAASTGNKGVSGITITASSAGLWGNSVEVTFSPSSKACSQVIKNLGGNLYELKNASGFNVGDVVEAVWTKPAGSDPDRLVEYNYITQVNGNKITLAGAFSEELPPNLEDNDFAPNTIIRTCEFDMEVQFDDVCEAYRMASFNPEADNFIEKLVTRSNLIQVSDAAQITDATPPLKVLNGFFRQLVIILTGGSDGDIAGMLGADYTGKDGGPGRRTGIQAFLDNTDVSIMAVPGITFPDVHLGLISHCTNLSSRFAVLDVPFEARTVEEVLRVRDIVDSDFSAMYHPWVEIFDPLERRSAFIPPSGSVMGIFARSDRTRGVHKAPANETVNGATGLSVSYNTGEQDLLNPKGVNLIRRFPGQGIRVWGARTTSSRPMWRYVNVRRLFIFLEETIRQNTNWVVFEPNDELLWIRVKRTIEVFLENVWRNGALVGGSASEAFFVNIGPSTMTQDDIDNGRLICVIGVAPVKPAEFVIFRITQKTAE